MMIRTPTTLYMNRPFLDANAKRGKPKLTGKSVAKTKAGKAIRFELCSKTHIMLRIPSVNLMGRLHVREIKVNKQDGIRLAHWLLDNCTK